MQTMEKSNTIISIAVLITLLFGSNGCIPVEEFGAYWDKGIVDKELEGHWKQLSTTQQAEYEDETQYVTFNKSADYLEVKIISPFASLRPGQLSGYQCKTLAYGKHKYLMIDLESYYKALKEKALEAAEQLAMSDISQIDKLPFKGALQMYAIKDGRLTFYVMDQNKLHEAIKEGKISGKIPEEEKMMSQAMISLDEQTLKFLSEKGNDEAYWKQTVSFERIKDIQKDIDELTKYPATAETAQNTLVNVDQPDLKYFAEGRSDILLRFLQSSPEWMVTIDNNDIVCYSKKTRDGEYQDLYSGYEHYSPDPNYNETASGEKWKEVPAFWKYIYYFFRAVT